MFLVVGLGNKGTRYENTRHNAGFIVVDEIQKGKTWEHSSTCNLMYSWDGSTEYIKPLTMMNLSGEAVSCAMRKHDIYSEEVIVVYDDIDLPFGEWKISFARSSGGHNGVKSVEEMLDTNRFVRIRVGIAPTTLFGKKKKPSVVDRYVLGPFPKGKVKALQKMAPEIQEAIETIIKDGREVAMNKYN